MNGRQLRLASCFHPVHLHEPKPTVAPAARLFYACLLQALRGLELEVFAKAVFVGTQECRVTSRSAFDLQPQPLTQAALHKVAHG